MNKWSCGFDYPYGIACWLGNIASILFFIVYVPQFFLNYQRKSVEGFSMSSVIIKLTGASFLCINSLFNGAGFPVFFYGFLNSLQHIIFLLQFFMYNKSKKALICLIIPVFPLLLALFLPQTIPYTDLIKPICQIASHFPQLVECVKLHTTMGFSLFGQHLNFTGAVLGIIMCFMINEQNIKTRLLYYNSLFQALSIYALAIYYKEWRFFDQKFVYSKFEPNEESFDSVEEDHPFL